MTFDSWSAIDSGDSVIRNRKITTVVLGSILLNRSTAELTPEMFFETSCVPPAAWLTFRVIS